MKNGIPKRGYNYKQVEFYNAVGGLSGLKDVIEYCKKNIPGESKNSIALKFGISNMGLNSILKDPEEKKRIFKLIEKDLR